MLSTKSSKLGAQLRYPRSEEGFSSLASAGVAKAASPLQNLSTKEVPCTQQAERVPWMVHGGVCGSRHSQSCLLPLHSTSGGFGSTAAGKEQIAVSKRSHLESTSDVSHWFLEKRASRILGFYRWMSIHSHMSSSSLTFHPLQGSFL